jgi:thymidylate synthase (FAD)
METKRTVVPAAEEILGGYFPVLDHGFVSLIDYMGTDESIEQAARVSYGFGTRKTSQTRGLVRYLRRHRHTTPSEMVELKFHCAMPMFVARQWIRHRTVSVNEYSARYSLMPLLFYKPDYEDFAIQSASNRQGREGDSAPREIYEEAVRRWEEVRSLSSDTYGWLVEEDVARELARIDLPLSTYTQWYWKIDLHNLFHFLSLRADSHAQWDIQEFAKVMAGMMKRVAPLSYEAWLDYEFAGQHMSHGELEALRALIEAGEDGVRARDGVSLDIEALKGAGLSKREAIELIDKLRPVERPDFELDLTRMQSPEVFQSRMQAAVPGDFE